MVIYYSTHKFLKCTANWLDILVDVMIKNVKNNLTRGFSFWIVTSELTTFYYIRFILQKPPNVYLCLLLHIWATHESEVYTSLEYTTFSNVLPVILNHSLFFMSISCKYDCPVDATTVYNHKLWRNERHTIYIQLNTIY